MDGSHEPQPDGHAESIAARAQGTLAARLRLRYAARRKAATVIGACAVALCTAAALPAIAAAAAPTGITGTVVNGSEGGSTPLEGVNVCAEEVGGGPRECAITDSHGEYTVEVAEGNYEVSFEKPEFSPEEMSDIPVTSEQLFDLGTVSLYEEGEGTISGTVTAAATGQPLGGIEVCVYFGGGCVETAANGTYTLSNVPSGSWYVSFEPGNACEEEMGVQIRCMPNANYIGQGQESVRVHVGQTTTTNVALQTGGEIAGTVTNASIAHPAVAKTFVCATKVNGKGETGPEKPGEAWEYESGCAYTNASGQYAITGLASGSWKVEFEGYVCTVIQKEQEPECPDLYVDAFYHGASSFRTATPVAVTAGAQTAGIDESLHEAFPKAPAGTAAPAITGTAAVGAALTCSPGTWSGEPLFLDYQWQRSGVAIAGATGATYDVQGADVGHKLTCVVLAGNGAGAASATSNALAIPKPVAVAARVAKVKGGNALLKISCSGAASCRGSLELVARQVLGRHGKRHASTVTIGASHFSVAAGKTATVRVHLNAKGKALLRASTHGKLSAKLAGNGVKARSVLLKAAKKATAHKKGKHHKKGGSRK